MILHLPGSAALPDFRLKKHLVALQRVLPSVSRVQAFYEYFIETEKPSPPTPPPKHAPAKAGVGEGRIKVSSSPTPLSKLVPAKVGMEEGKMQEAELERLDRLLNAEALLPRTFDRPATLILVLPRTGTVSPWSSKATDIAHLCGFSHIKRLERGVSYYLETDASTLSAEQREEASALLHDRMLETVFYTFENTERLFAAGKPAPLHEIALQKYGKSALEKANLDLGLALSEAEIDYFFKSYQTLARNPTDVELMMFAQANSEHCRHKIFNARWTIDGVEQAHSLFSMIRNTHEKSPQGVLSAYKDNAAIFEGPVGKRFFLGKERRYQQHEELIHAVIKVETHNHPTAIAPFPGAATGAGGEIRDEGATGRGAKPKAGLTGFSVSHLRIPDFIQPWETPLKKPAHIASSLDIMLQGPIGGAAFNNEFGRPIICGYFRTFESDFLPLPLPSPPTPLPPVGEGSLDDGEGILEQSKIVHSETKVPRTAMDDFARRKSAEPPEFTDVNEDGEGLLEQSKTIQREAVRTAMDDFARRKSAEPPEFTDVNEDGKGILQQSKIVHSEAWGYHKPIMLSGGLANVRSLHTHKHQIDPDDLIIVLGGPALLIGLGGGAASSTHAHTDRIDLDFASVQRANPEMERRCQEVIDACWALGEANPIVSIHDVGAGGLSNAIPEIVHESGRGAKIQLRDIPSDDPHLSPLEIWCNEAQERYVLILKPDSLPLFDAMAKRERCPFAVVGIATADERLVVEDSYFQNFPIDLPMVVLFGKPPKLHMNMQTTIAPLPKLVPAQSGMGQGPEVRRNFSPLPPLPSQGHALGEGLGVRVHQHVGLHEIITRVLRFPSVASKQFLITIGDRTVGGLVARDQMVGPWQVPVADVGVTATDFEGYTGEAMAMGERTPLGVLHPAACARMAVGEAITNIIAADVRQLSDIKLSANWMAAAKFSGQALALFEAVKAVGLEICPALDLCIPVGKDSLFMQTQWEEEGNLQKVVSPLSPVISAFAQVADIRQTLTPELLRDTETALWLIDLGAGQDRLGGSTYLQICSDLNCYSEEHTHLLHSHPEEHTHLLHSHYSHPEEHAKLPPCHPEEHAKLRRRISPKTIADVCPDVDNPEYLRHFFDAISALRQANLLLAYHDRSDGGLWATLCEMAFASHTGLDITIPAEKEVIAFLFNEELGAVVQIPLAQETLFLEILRAHQLESMAVPVARLNREDTLVISHNEVTLCKESRITLQKTWSETSFHMQKLRDNPDCAQEEFDGLSVETEGLYVKLPESTPKPIVHLKKRPPLAILREQGVNGHIEMAAAFTRAGFDCFDVHMTDLLEKRVKLEQFVGFAAVGGFSYGDVLGAGRGWASTILHNPYLSDAFSVFFERPDTFALGVCNGCQMMAQLKPLIPGASHWPVFTTNRSQQFEARFSMVEIPASSSMLFQGMAGAQLPVAISHGEGRADWSHPEDFAAMKQDNTIALRYVDHQGKVTERYPFNPNGSPEGVAGITNQDGRVTLLMPHPERVFRTVQWSWHPSEWGEDSPWMQIFWNMRAFVK